MNTDEHNTLHAAVTAKAAESIAAVLLDSAKCRRAEAKLYAAEAAGADEHTLNQLERSANAYGSAAVDAYRVAEAVMETAEICGIRAGDALRIAAEREARTQSAGQVTIGEAVDQIDAEARTIRRAIRRSK